ncbi:unnamed protein product, partial [Urochloa humidicola]
SSFPSDLHIRRRRTHLGLAQAIRIAAGEPLPVGRRARGPAGVRAVALSTLRHLSPRWRPAARSPRRPGPLQWEPPSSRPPSRPPPSSRPPPPTPTTQGPETDKKGAVVERLKVQAIKKDIKQSPKKVNLVAKLVRGMRVEDALLQLQVTVKRAAKSLYQVIHSARANAARNHGLDPDKLIVEEAFVGKGLYLKRLS